MRSQLDAIVLQMHLGGIRYDEAIRKFRKQFIATVLEVHKGNQVKTSRKLHIHRNTLRRIISDLEVDVKAIRSTALRGPPQAERPLAPQKEKLF
jgi:Fis family transcriptional regulator